MSSGGASGPHTPPRLGYLFKHAQQLMSELHGEVLAPYDIQARDLGVLLVIDGAEPASQQEIAIRMGVDRTTMVALIDGLETKGIIMRRPDPDDRRRNVLELTAAGQSVLRQALAASDAAEADLLAPLSAAEGAQLRALLTRVVTARQST